VSIVVLIAVLICYGSLLVELTILHTPSVASSRRLWSPVEGELDFYSKRYRRLFSLSPAHKLVRFILPLVIVYIVFAYPLAELWLGPALLGDYLYEPNRMVNTIAVCTMVVGRVMTLSSVIALRGAVATENEFLQTGFVFRWSRNPGLVGMYLMFAGFWIAMPSVLFLVGLLVYVTHMHFRVRIEEDYLANRYGESFIRYRDSTPRYLL
jgi:protein-S-isoprenylcysteine O-methyltransferase Ste14